MTLKTVDGYLIDVFRIPQDGPPVLLGHGNTGSMYTWIHNHPEVAVPFVLARQGYDVWMVNFRGTIMSSQHESLDTEAPEFWSFTFEEMGIYDLPKVIDHIIETTGHDKINYIGYSQGATALLAGGSLMPEYFNSRVNLAVFLGPSTSQFYNPNPVYQFQSEFWEVW